MNRARQAAIASLCLLAPLIGAVCGNIEEMPELAEDAEAKDAEAATPTASKIKVESVLTGLDIPWALAFAPDGRVFLTERPGAVKVYDSKFELLDKTSIPVHGAGEGGLLGLTLHPQFSNNHYVYVYTTNEASDGSIVNRVSRYLEAGNRLIFDRIILDNLPGSSVHNGGRIQFGPDGKLYVTAGDSAQKELAQKLDSQAGKLHRVNDDGTTPGDNPLPGSTIYSYGHRNPQCLAWDASDRMYEAEHGPSGFDGPGGYDEANYIQPGKNYGWPKYGEVKQAGLVDPLFLSIAPIAPSGCTIYTGSAIPEWKGNFLIAMLRGQHLRRIVIDTQDPSKRKSDEVLLGKVSTPEGTKEADIRYSGEYGRLREVVQGPDGWIYLLTSNRDGRAQKPFPTAEDDRLLRIRSSK